MGILENGNWGPIRRDGTREGLHTTIALTTHSLINYVQPRHHEMHCHICGYHCNQRNSWLIRLNGGDEIFGQGSDGKQLNKGPLPLTSSWTGKTKQMMTSLSQVFIFSQQFCSGRKAPPFWSLACLVCDNFLFSLCVFCLENFGVLYYIDIYSFT